MASELLEDNNLLSALTNISVDFSELGKLLGINPENRGVFWKNLIELLKSQESPLDGENNTNSANDEPLTNTEESIFDFISYYCDLNDKDIDSEVYLSYIFDTLKQIYRDTEGETIPKNSFWNYSVQEMVNHYMKYYSSEYDHSNDPLIAGTNYTRRHLRNANAGLSFKDTNWVEPNFNVNDKTYDQVRGYDEVNDILANAHKMQFTHTRLQEDIEGKGGYISDEITDSTYAEPNEGKDNDDALNKWIRLLMPQYGRRVEIEDLDRNFWVIAQVIAALSGFLFDDESPITEMFKHLLNEIIQLWENVMYLWAEAAITSQKICTDVRIITLPIPNAVEYPYRKFDNFSLEYDDSVHKEKDFWGNYDLRFVRSRSSSNERNNPYYIIANNNWTGYDSGYEYYKQSLSSTEIKERIEFLADKYPNDNLIIVPFERLRNYKHNWYGCQLYRYIYTYHRGQNQWTTYRIRTYLDTTTTSEKEMYFKTYFNDGDLSGISDLSSDAEYSSTIQDLIAGFPATLAPIRFKDEDDNDFDSISNKFTELYHADKIYGIRENEDIYGYDYISPFIDSESKNVSKNTRYYGNLRVDVNINYNIAPNELSLTGVIFSIYDAAAPLIEGNDVRVAAYMASIDSEKNIFSDEDRKGKIGYEINEEDLSPKVWLRKISVADIRTETPSEVLSSIDYKTLIDRKSLYMGETVSYYSDIVPINIEINNIGTVEIAGYNQVTAPSEYSGGADNVWSSASSIEKYTWTNSSGESEYNNVELISSKYIEEMGNDNDLFAVKIIYPRGGQGDFSFDSTEDEYYYYLNKNNELVKATRGSTTWNTITGMLSHGLYVKSELLNVEKFFSNYTIERINYTGTGAVNNIYTSGLYLFKKKNENLSDDNWAVVSIDLSTPYEDGELVYVSSYVFIGYADGATEEFTESVVDFSNEEISNYEQVIGTGNIEALETKGLYIFDNYLTNLIS